jgi:pimeloyl-ACP methyl ester carboxylesterase
MQLKVDGHAVYVHTGGQDYAADKPALIFVHGGGNDHTFWSLQARFFAHHGYSVLVPDLPGHGRSEGTVPDNIDDYASWLWRFLDTIGAEKAVLVGHSMGSLAVLAAAAQQPDRMLALVLAGTSDHMQVHPDLLTLAAADDPVAFELITDWGFGKLAHKGGNQAPGLWLRGGGRALLASCQSGVLGTDMAACNAWKGALEAAGSITCSTLFLLADSDRMTPPRSSNGLQAVIANAQVEILVGAGHMMTVERPNETIDIIHGFLGGAI